MKKDILFAASLAALWALFVGVVYMPDVGRGFVKDDFRWVDAGRAALDDPAAAFSRPRSDFYRPIVELTFAADYAVHGMQPRGYGFTNVALYAACVVCVFAVARALGLSVAAGALAAMVWAVNPHGINMAVVWISGRTSLCATLFALLAAIAMLRGRYTWTALFTFAALGAKEEALLLPIVLIGWDHWITRNAHTPAVRRLNRPLVAQLILATAFYGGLRLSTGAMTPASAPAYYQLTFSPMLVAQNAVEYLDRAGSIGAAMLLLVAGFWRVVPAIDARQRRLLAAALLWLGCGFAVTLFVPVRSSLYAVFPSVGIALACGVVVDGIRKAAATDPSLGRLTMGLAAVLIAALPIYRDRNGRYVEPARLSERALRTIAPHAAVMSEGSVIVLHDVDDPASNFSGAFGTFASDAVRMRAGHDVTVWIDSPEANGTNTTVPASRRDHVGAEFGVERGRIFRVAP